MSRVGRGPPPAGRPRRAAVRRGDRARGRRREPPRKDRPMRRRTVVVSALPGALAGAAALGRLDPARAAQTGTPTALARHPFVGTWIIGDPTGGEPTTNIITPDGGLIDPTVGAAGVWTATGPRT